MKNLEGFKFIPQSYTIKNKAVSLDDLVEVSGKPAEPVYPIKRLDDSYFVFNKSNFPFDETKGYTAGISPAGELYLFRSLLTEKGETKVNFLRGANPTPKFKSPFLALVFETVFPGQSEFYTILESDDVWKVVLSEVHVKAATPAIPATTTVIEEDIDTPVVAVEPEIGMVVSQVVETEVAEVAEAPTETPVTFIFNTPSVEEQTLAQSGALVDETEFLLNLASNS